MITAAELERLILIFRLNYRGVCFYCGKQMMSRKLSRKHPSYALAATYDHVHPLAKDGPDLRENKVPCCYRCNMKKADRTIDEYRQFLYGSVDVEFFFEYDIRQRMRVERLREPEVQNLEQKVGAEAPIPL